MQRHQFINTVSADLWNAIGEASDEASGDPGIPALVRAWTSQPGFPLVEVCRCRHGLGLELSQTHYRIDGQADDQGKTWPIPLRLQADGEERSLVLDAPRMTVPLINAAGLRVNVDRMSFCRVAYDETLFTELMLDLSEGRLTSIEERFALQDDARALAASGQRPITTFLEVCKANRAETEYSVWNGMLTGLNSIDGYLAWDGEDGGNPVIDQFVLTVIEDALARVGLIAQDGESAMTVKLRSMLANAAMAHGHRPTVDALIAMLASGATIDPNLRPAVYGAVARHHGAVGFEMLLARYRLEKDVEEKLRLLRALGRTSDLKLKRRALEFAFSSEVRAQDAYSGVASVAGTPAGIRLAWEFVKERWAFICERHQGNNAKIGYYLGVSEWLATPELLEDAKVFIEANPIEGLSMSAKQAIERIELNLQWRARNSAAAAAWLKDEFTL
jgi:aminopeptidase 2